MEEIKDAIAEPSFPLKKTDCIKLFHPKIAQNPNFPHKNLRETPTKRKMKRRQQVWIDSLTAKRAWESQVFEAQQQLFETHVQPSTLLETVRFFWLRCTYNDRSDF